MNVGLAFGGGATRGMAHLGALSVLVQEGIPIDCVAGCSAGSVISALFCAGITTDDMRKMAAHAKWRRIARPHRTPWGLVSFDRLERWLTMVLGDLDFLDLKIPLAIVATDAESGERVVIREGRVSKAVHASCAIPGLVNPVRMNGRLLFDGGVVDNLPVAAARELGADFVVGIDVFEPNLGRSGSPFKYGLTAIELAIRHTGGGISAADLLILPRTAGRSFVGFKQYFELIALGERAAKDKLPSLLGELARSRDARAGTDR